MNSTPHKLPFHFVHFLSKFYELRTTISIQIAYCRPSSNFFYLNKQLVPPYNKDLLPDLKRQVMINRAFNDAPAVALILAIQKEKIDKEEKYF